MSMPRTWMRVVTGAALVLALPVLSGGAVAGERDGQDSKPPLASIAPARPATVSVSRQRSAPPPRPAAPSRPSTPKPNQVVPYQPIRSAPPARPSQQKTFRPNPQRPSPTVPRAGGTE
jgi:hypothetical protein